MVPVYGEAEPPVNEARGGGRGWTPMNFRAALLRNIIACRRERMAVVKKVSCMQPGQKSIKKLDTAGRPYWRRLRI